jgi:spermidine synthase
MLGMTAGAVTVYLKPGWFSSEKLSHSIAKACLGFAIITPCSLYCLSRLPVSLEISLQAILSLIILTIACLLPFYFSGVAITAVLTKYKLPIGKLYAADLTGASLGCLFVLGVMQIMDAPSLILLTSFIGAIAAISFAWPIYSFRPRHATLSVIGLLAVLVILNTTSPFAIQLHYVKGYFDDPKSHFLEEWNSFSRVVVYNPEYRAPALWGPSENTPSEPVLQYRTDIDGGAGTWVTRFSSTEDIEYLRYDITNMVHQIRPDGNVCIIGSGGGRDIQSAILFGHQEITGIDVNPIFINLLQNQFREFAGIADHSGVKLVVDEARSYLSRTQEKYSVIQMSLVDTWAATAAGAFTLSENGLYTVESWRIFFNCLKDDGVFTASRHYMPGMLDETGRAVSLATAMLYQNGITEPARHIAVIAAEQVSTLLISKQPFSPAEMDKLRSTSAEMGFKPIVMPDEQPDHTTLENILYSGSLSALSSAISEEVLNFQPSTDDNPYFFNMLRVNHLEVLNWSDTGVLAGNISATFTLGILILVLFIICIAGIVTPLILRSKTKSGGKYREKVLWSGAFYFALIGAGFMFVEIGLIQRLSVFLGHPVYGLGVLLFTVIASAGIGSYISDRLPLVKLPWVILYPVIVALMVIAIRFALPWSGSIMESSSTLTKIAVSISLIAPLGMLMGVCFPTGMRLVRLTRGSETPWYWALNGMFGVFCSALAVFVAIYVSISACLYIGAFFYIALLFCLPGLLREAKPPSHTGNGHSIPAQPATH